MQKRQGYCTYCRVIYTNLEQHLFSARHRTLTRENRERLRNSNSLMERFLQDVLQHHASNYQETTPAQSETPTNTAAPEAIRLEEAQPEDTGIEEISSESSESVEELNAQPDACQNSTKEVSVRPSVIQKLEKGQQQSLEFNKIESGVRKINPVGVGQATNSGKSVIRLPVICNASASCLAGISVARPVAASTSRAPPAASSESVSEQNPTKGDTYLEQLDEVSKDCMPSCRPGTSSGSYENPEESNGKSICMNLDKLPCQKDVKCQGETSPPPFKFREPMPVKGSGRVRSSSKAAVHSAVELIKPDGPPAKRFREGAILKHRGEILSRPACTQREEHVVSNKPEILKRKFPVSAKVNLDCSSFQSVSVPPRRAVQELHLWKDDQGDHEDEDQGCQDSGTSISYDFFPHSPLDLSNVTARKRSLSGETLGPVPYESNKAQDSQISSADNRDDSLQVVDNQPKVTVQEESPQQATHTSQVDKSYDPSDLEVNFYRDNSTEPPDNSRQQPDIDVIFPCGVLIDLVDKNYGSDNSEGSAAPVAVPEPVVGASPVGVTKKKPHICLMDKSYGPGYAESSSDNDGSSQSAAEHPQMTVIGGNQKGDPVQLENQTCKPSSAKAHLSCGVSLEAMTHQPQDVEEKSLQKNAGLMEMNYGSQAPEMNFHADAQLVADESQVAVKEVNPEAGDIDLDNQSVQSSVSDLSLESQDCLYQSDDELEGDVGEGELNVDVEAQSSGSSSSELTFDSDSPLLSVTERSPLDVERLKEDLFNLEEESCESNSSGITFDSDIPTCSVADQPQVAVYEEEPVDLENESDESCVSEITFDSDIPLHSGDEQAEVAAKEVIIQEEDYVHLEKKNANPSGSEINLDSYTPLHSVTNPQVAIRKLNSQKEEQVPLKHKENELTGSGLDMNYSTFHSTIMHSEDCTDRNFQKEEQVHLENKQDKPSVSGTQLDSDIPCLSVIHKPQVVVKNIWLHKEKQAEFQGTSAEFSASEVKSNVPHCPVTEPRVSLKKKEKTKHIEKKTDKYDDFELILNSDDFSFPKSILKKPRLAVLQEDLVHPEEARSDVTGSVYSGPDQPHLILCKEKHAGQKDKSSKRNDSKMSFQSVDHLQSLPKQQEDVTDDTNLQKEEESILPGEIDVPSCSKAVYNSVVFLKSAPDQCEVAVKLISQRIDVQMCLENKSRNVCVEMNLALDFLVQAIIDRPHIAVDKSKGAGKPNSSGDSEGNSDSAASVQPGADQLREMVKETASEKDEDIDIEGKRGGTKGIEIIHDSDVPQPVTGQVRVIQEVKVWKKQLDLEDKNSKCSHSKVKCDSNEPPQSVTNKIQEPIKEATFPVKGHVCVDDKGYKPDSSEITYISNIPLRSVIQQSQSLQVKRANLEMSSDPRPTTSFDSSEPCQSMPGRLQKSVREINLKEGHIYLEDKSYKLVGFEASYNSDVPVQLVVDPSHAPAEERNVQKDHNGPGNETNKDYCSDIHLHSEADPSQVAWKEMNFENKELFDMEEKASEPCDSEMICDSDSDVSFQIIVTQSQSSDDEADSPEVVFVNVVAGDCDREGVSDPLQLVTEPPQLTIEGISDPEVPLQLVTEPPQLTIEGVSDPEVPLQLVTEPPHLTIEGISDPEVPLQLVRDPPQLTIEETSRVKAGGSVAVGKCYCDVCGSQLRYGASSQSVTNQFKKTFKIINRNSDYIILGDSTCQSCGCEIEFNADASYQSRRPNQENSPSEGRRSDGPERNFYFEGTSQETNTEVNLRKDPEYTSLDEETLESSGSASSTVSSESVIHHTADRANLLKLKQADLENKSGATSPQIDFQHGPSIQADIEQPQEAVKKTRPQKRVTFDTKEYHYFPSNYVCVVESVKSRDETPEVREERSDGPSLEGSPRVPPPVSTGETQPENVRDEISILNDILMKFQNGDFRCCFHNNHTTNEALSSEETEPTRPNLNLSTICIQIPQECAGVAGGISLIPHNISAMLEKLCCHCPLAVELLKQNWFVASLGQILKVDNATQTNIGRYPLKKRKTTTQEAKAPKRKCLQGARKGNKTEDATAEVPTTSAEALRAEPPSSSMSRLAAVRRRRKVAKTSRSSSRSRSRKAKKGRGGSRLQAVGKGKQSNPKKALPKKSGGNPAESTGSDTSESGSVPNGSDGDSSAGESSAPTQNVAQKAYIKTAKYKLQSRGNESYLVLENIEDLPSKAPQASSFQPPPSNPDDASVSPQSDTNQRFQSKSKKKVRVRRVTTSVRPGFSQRIYKTVIVQQKNGVTSEKRSVWIRTKTNSIIRKYSLKYSVFLRHRYQTRTTFFAVNPKKKIPGGVRREEGREPGQMVLNSSVPPAPFQEQFTDIAGPSRKQLVLRSSSTAGRSKVEDKTYTYKKKTPTLVRAYNLRSSRCAPTEKKMTTRLSGKQND